MALILCSCHGAISVRLSSVPHWLRHLFSEVVAACGLIFAGLQILVTCIQRWIHARRNIHIIPQLEILLFHNLQLFPFLISINSLHLLLLLFSPVCIIYWPNGEALVIAPFRNEMEPWHKP
jgi:hypothetical protein